MNLLKNIHVPTGNILIVQGEKGKLECLSIGDYGKEANIKADFMGITRQLSELPKEQQLLPLEEKWVITISTQYGCSMGCKFCNVPKVGPGINASYMDLINQIEFALKLHPEIRETKRLNIHYARMGEPTFNRDVIAFSQLIKDELRPMVGNSLIHPVVSTMMPNNNARLRKFLEEWLYIKNEFQNGEAGLQLSINSTSDAERDIMFNGNSLKLREISDLMSNVILKAGEPEGRKITLNFALFGYEIDPVILYELFNPEHFMIKLTPMHKTNSYTNDTRSEGYEDFYEYQKIEEDLKDIGFDVLVFAVSEFEDQGRITCGNAILSGSLPECKYSVEDFTNE